MTFLHQCPFVRRCSFACYTFVRCYSTIDFDEVVRVESDLQLNRIEGQRFSN